MSMREPQGTLEVTQLEDDYISRELVQDGPSPLRGQGKSGPGRRPWLRR